MLYDALEGKIIITVAPIFSQATRASPSTEGLIRSLYDGLSIGLPKQLCFLHSGYLLECEPSCFI